MASYSYTSSGSTTQSANLATDKVRIATTTSAIHFVTGSSRVAGSGTVTAATNTAVVTGVGTLFLTETAVGKWVGNTTGATSGIVQSIANNLSLTLTANSAVAIAGAAYTLAPTANGYAIATTADRIIPAGVVERSIIVGQGNVVAFLTAGTATAAVFSVTELGAPHQTGGSGSY